MCKKQSKKINKYINEIKISNGIPSNEELKWHKISKANIKLYTDVINYFFDKDQLNFRAIIIDKRKLHHRDYKHTENEFYHISYYIMLKYIITPGNSYNIFPDIKDTNSYHNHKIVRDFLRKKYGNDDGKTIKQVTPIRSYESNILQLTDILIGALSYYYRGLNSNEAKVQIINKIKEKLPYSIDRSTAYNKIKFNILLWEPKNHE